MNPDLAIERQNTPFDFRAVSSFLYGGDKALERRRVIGDFVDSIPDFNDTQHISFMDSEQRHENSLRKTVAMLKHAEKINLQNSQEMEYYHQLILPRERQLTSVSMQYIMFLPTIQGQCTDEQQKKWLPLIESNQVIGTYAQTELGHGSNLRMLETTATYDPARQEFVINSPTLTSTKWWPGNLGKTANYAVVLAQLHTKGVNHGIQAFMVQLRDLETHQPLPGITVGDIGPKFGFHSNDNGFLRFDHIRIPRDNMLMRFSSVEPDGTYRPPKHQKLVYGAMIYIRSAMIRGMAIGIAIAATIATRYSCVRRQGEKVEGGGEVKLLDYQTQQYRLFPQIAKSYAFTFAATYLQRIHDDISNRVLKGDLELLPELHIMSSGLKAYVTFEVAKGIEICRLSCGGHGYSRASGLPELYTDNVGGCTYEGDNIVMFLQVARHLVKTVRRKSGGGLSSYLWKKGGTKSALDSELKLTDLLDIYEHASRRVIFETVQHLEELVKGGDSSEQAWHKCSVELTKCAKVHVRVFLVKNFLDVIETAKDQNVKNILRLLCQLYALYDIHVKPGDFVQDGYVSYQQLTYIRRRVYQILAEIRPIAVPLVDAFDFRDRQLNSVLGRYDGNVYENLLKWASNSPLNQKQVLDSHHKYIAPMMKRSKL